MEVFRDMIARKIEPGLVACNFVLTHFSKNRAGEEALEFLEIMKKVRVLTLQHHHINVHLLNEVFLSTDRPLML